MSEEGRTKRVPVTLSLELKGKQQPIQLHCINPEPVKDPNHSHHVYDETTEFAFHVVDLNTMAALDKDINVPPKHHICDLRTLFYGLGVVVEVGTNTLGDPCPGMVPSLAMRVNPAATSCVSVLTEPISDEEYKEQTTAYSNNLLSIGECGNAPTWCELKEGNVPQQFIQYPLWIARDPSVLIDMVNDPNRKAVIDTLWLWCDEDSEFPGKACDKYEKRFAMWAPLIEKNQPAIVCASMTRSYQNLELYVDACIKPLIHSMETSAVYVETFTSMQTGVSLIVLEPVRNLKFC